MISAIHEADGCQSGLRPPQVRLVAVPTGPPGNCEVKTCLVKADACEFSRKYWCEAEASNAYAATSRPAIDRTVDCVTRASIIQRAVSGQAPEPVSIVASKP